MPTYAVGATFYFLEKDDHTSLLYKAICSETTCSLSSLSISTTESVMKCGLHYYSLFENEKATKSGDAWVLTASSGSCGYTNSYTISKSGMVQVKTSPAKPLASFCESFAPKVYKMEPTTKKVGLPVTGCKEIFPVGF
jgi:hypothetical protein